MSTLPDPLWEPIKIVYGVYRLRGEWAGDDRWWIQRLVESETGWMVHADLYLDQPQSRYITLDVELSEGWAWRYLNLRDDHGQMLSAEVAGDRLIVEQGGVEQALPFDDASELDFLSPFMTTLTLRRLRLEPGQQVTRPRIAFDAATFAPRLSERRYTRGEDRTLSLQGETMSVQQIHLHDTDQGSDYTLLVREDGLVLHWPGIAELALDEQASAGRGRRPPL